jgi:hypothetical protein
MYGMSLGQNILFLSGSSCNYREIARAEHINLSSGFNPTSPGVDLILLLQHCNVCI